MKLFADNPLIERYRYSSMRPKQIWVFGFIFTTIILIMLMVNVAMYVEHGTYESVYELCASLYFQFFALLFLVLCVLTSTATASALREEIAAGSYDFFRMLPLSAHYKAVGILLGRNLLTLIMAAALAVLTAFVGVTGGVSPGLILQMLFCVLAFALFFNCMALFSSINPNRKVTSQQSQSVGVVVALLLILPFMIGGMMTVSRTTDLEVLMVSFFGAKVPLLILIASIVAYLSVWIYLGICRKFDKESEPVMTKPGALIFLAGGMTLLLGLLGPHMSGPEGFAAVMAYWATSFVIAVLLPPGFSLWRQRYMEIRSLNSAMPRPEFLLKHSNLSAGVLLFALWAVPALGTAYYASEPINGAALHVLNLFAFYLIFCGLVELMATTDPVNNRLKILLAFLAILFIVLPLIVAATLGSGQILVLSILGYFGVIMDDNPTLREMPEAYLVLAVNICLILLLWLFVKRSYAQLFPGLKGRS